MQTFFGPDFFSANRARLRERLGNGILIVITGNGQMQRSADEPFKFHQESNFWYLTGLNIPDLTLVMTVSDTYLIVPTLSSIREAFDGSIDPEMAAARSGITTILSVKDGLSRLKTEVTGAAEVATLAAPPSYMKHHGIFTLPYRRRLITQLKRMRPDVTIRDIRPELTQMRVIKRAEEIQAIQAAVDITAAALRTAASPGVLGTATFEYQLEASISHTIRSSGADGHAFAPIVGAGTHTTTLHHVENNGPITAEDLIILDIGAAVEHYSADVARTIAAHPIDGRKAAVFHAVAAAQDYALSLIKPGVMQQEYETAVEQFIGEQLRMLGLIKTSNREAIRTYFPHMTSHFLGLDTHDVGDYQSPWQPNMIITCEPGIYIPEEGIGVRIEDDILITETGCRILSAACPRELTAVQ